MVRWCLALILLAGVAAPAAAQTRSAPEGPGGGGAASAVRAVGGMVVAANPLAAEAGAAMLRAGGTAADAAIAAQLVLNVVEPQSSGLGGGGFLLFWDGEAQSLETWDGRETAPRAVDDALFLGPDGSPLPFRTAVASGRSVGAPGLGRLLEALHRRHGSLSWARLAEPAIRLAEDGFSVSPRLAGLLARFEARLAANPRTRALFFGADGRPLRAGDRLRNPALAATLRALARNGPGALYEGRIARAVALSVSAPPRPGLLDGVDLAAYAAKRRPPLCLRYRDRFEVCGMGPPSSGASTVGQILGLLERSRGDVDTLWHRFLEASRLAYADRALYLADPDFETTPARGLLDPAYLAPRARALDPERASTGPAAAGRPAWREGRLPLAPDAAVKRAGTTHLSVVDRDGSIVSLTSSIEGAFGSGRIAAGFLLNNQLTDFSFAPMRDGKPVANRVAPLKRPRSSMAPTIVFEVSEGARRPVLVIGSPGGSRIPEYVARAIVEIVDLGRDPAMAAAGVNLSHRNRTMVQVEAGLVGDGLAAALSRRGHAVTRAVMTSGLHIIQIAPDGALIGGADPRREGRAIGVEAGAD